MFLLFTLLLFVILLIPIPIKINIKGTKDNFFIYIYNKKLDIKKLIKTTNIKKKKETETKKNINKTMFIKNTLSKLKNNKFKPNLNIKINFNYGFDDSAYTGICYGLIYSLSPMIYKLLTTIFNIKKHKLDIKPDFHNIILKLTINSIIFINIAKIIYISLIILKSLNSSKKITTQNT